MSEERIVTVKNRNAGGTGYVLNDGTRQFFEYGEVKKIPLSQLEELSYAPGGESILRDCLVVEDQSALDYLNIDVQPEYFYSEEDIKDILFRTDNESLDLLEDTLNFAPQGVIELVKKFAVELEIPDNRKRELITEKTGLNVNTAINIKNMNADGQTGDSEGSTVKRKTKPLDVKPTPERKAPAASRNKYKVVSK